MPELTQAADATTVPVPPEQAAAAPAAPTPTGPAKTTPAAPPSTPGEVAPSTTFPPSPESDASPTPESSDADRSGLDASGALGGQYFWVREKIMPGVVLRPAVDRYSLDLEATFIYLAERSPEFDGVFLGNEFGIYLSAGVLFTRRLELRGGIGGDIYYLWGINGDEVQAALSAKAAFHVWPWRSFGLCASVRSYLVSGSGLELGTTREGDERVPLLVATGFELRMESRR